MNDAIKEALLEAGRVVLFALISWALAKFAVLPQTETVMVGTILLRALDKFLHERAGTKQTGWLGERGLAGF